MKYDSHQSKGEFISDFVCFGLEMFEFFLFNFDCCNLDVSFESPSNSCSTNLLFAITKRRQKDDKLQYLKQTAFLLREIRVILVEMCYKISFILIKCSHKTTSCALKLRLLKLFITSKLQYIL